MRTVTFECSGPHEKPFRFDLTYGLSSASCPQCHIISRQVLLTYTCDVCETKIEQAPQAWWEISMGIRQWSDTGGEFKQETNKIYNVHFCQQLCMFKWIYCLAKGDPVSRGDGPA